MILFVHVVSFTRNNRKRNNSDCAASTSIEKLYMVVLWMSLLITKIWCSKLYAYSKSSKNFTDEFDLKLSCMEGKHSVQVDCFLLPPQMSPITGENGSATTIRKEWSGKLVDFLNVKHQMIK